MTTVNDIICKDIEDYKKAKIVQIILLEEGFKCFVEVDSRYIRIEDLDVHQNLTEKNLHSILEFTDMETAKIRTEMGMRNIFYIPISH